MLADQNEHTKGVRSWRKQRIEQPPPEMQGQPPGTILEELARQGAQQLLAQALEVEVEEFLEKHQGKTDVEGRRQVVRNGYMPARQLVTRIGRGGGAQRRTEKSSPWPVQKVLRNLKQSSRVELEGDDMRNQKTQ